MILHFDFTLCKTQLTTKSLKIQETDCGSFLAGKSRKSQHLQDPTPDFLTNANLSDMDAVPSINNIDDYVELLYEDVPSKIKASILIFCLIKNSDNLEALLEHGKLRLRLCAAPVTVYFYESFYGGFV